MSKSKRTRKAPPTSTLSSSTTAEEAIYQATRQDLEKCLLHLASSSRVSDEELTNFLSPNGIKSKRRKIAASELRVTNPRGESHSFPIGSFSRIPIYLTLAVLRHLNFKQRVELMTTLSKGFRSPRLRNDPSLWTTFHADLQPIGTNATGFARMLDALVISPSTVQNLRVVSASKGGATSREVIRIISCTESA